MNNKGFTLIELLAVILILSLLALLANTSVTKVVRDSKTDLYDSQMQIIKLAAESWGSENIDKLPDNGKCKYITLGDLKNYGLLDTSVKNPKTDKEFSNDMNIKITATENKYGKTNISYEVDSDNINECEIAVEKTLDRICTYDKTSTVPEKTAGAKYSCEVKPGTSYNFYVLATPKEGDTTINLIMDRNICEDGTPATAKNTCLVAYNSSRDVSGTGPVTAMDHLYKATKDWTNIPNIEMNYTDEGNTGDYGYGTIVTTDNITKITKKDGTAVTVLTNQEGYSNLKARLPYKSEVANSNGSNEYLYENLDDSEWYGSGTQPTNNISGIYGYWTLSSIADSSGAAWRVFFNGCVGGYDAGNGSFIGVRAVINLKI